MGGLFSAGGLISGIDTNSLIAQLLQLERQPIVRINQRIASLNTQKEGIGDLRTQLQSLRSTVQDFRFGLDFSKFNLASTEESILTANASGSNPASGSFSVDVLQLASATIAASSSRIGGAINPATAFASSGVSEAVESGTFTINGTQFNFDFSTASLNDVVNGINASGANVNAAYDAVNDSISFTNTIPGDTSIINFGAGDDTSNFLSVLNVENALQITNGGGVTEVTSSSPLGAINQGNLLNAVNFGGGAISGGSFFVNGVQINVDPTVDGLTDVLERINNSDAGVTATFDPITDSIRVVSENLGSRTVGFTSGTSNFLDVLNLTTSIQTAGQDSQFTVDGGPVLTRNSNDISDVIGDVTFTLGSVGTASITVSDDDDSVIESINEFITDFNESITKIAELIGDNGNLRNDGSIRSIKNSLQTFVFQQVSGLGGAFQSLLDIGLSTGDDFDPSAVFQLELDEDKLKEALLGNRLNVERLFANDAEDGIADVMFAFLDEATKSGGFLDDRSKANGSIDKQIVVLNASIERIENRIEVKEARLRRQFANMERLQSAFQSQAGALGSLGAGFGGF